MDKNKLVGAEVTEKLPKEITDQIDHWIQKYPAGKQKSAVMQALMIVQEYNQGYLTKDLIGLVAEYLNMAPVAVLEVATFYSMYEHAPVGKHTLSVCTNVPCQLKGCQKIVEHLEKKCGAKMGENSPDGHFTLRHVECLGACVGAPVMQVDNKNYYENLTEEKVDLILNNLINLDEKK
jgi:NADH-quinone oxidoreductase subunit E